MRKIRTITICSSASFYKDVVEIQKELKGRGFRVLVPIVATKMKRSGDFDVQKVKTWYGNPKDYKIKQYYMKAHIQKVLKSDAILVVNKPRHGFQGYIGGNGLIEMFVAFQNKIPIFVLNPIDENLLVKEEVLGFRPTFINGDLSQIH